MEWGRAKTILILSFLFLNLLLGYQLWMNKLAIFGNAFGSSEEVNQVLEVLQSKGIALKQELPTDTPKVKEIDVIYRARASEDGRKSLEPVFVGPITNKSTEWQELLKEQIVQLSEYELDKVLTRDRVLVMNQIYEQLPLFGINLKLYIYQDSIEQYEQSYADVQPLSSTTKEQSALAAYRVVRLLAEKFLQEGDVIIDVRLGYHGQMFNSDTQVLAPKWRVTLEHGDVYYVHAISGEVERQ